MRGMGAGWGRHEQGRQGQAWDRAGMSKAGMGQGRKGAGQAWGRLGQGSHGAGQAWAGQDRYGIGKAWDRACMRQGRYGTGQGNIGVSFTIRHKERSDYQCHLWEELSQENSDSL